MGGAAVRGRGAGKDLGGEGVCGGLRRGFGGDGEAVRVREGRNMGRGGQAWQEAGRVRGEAGSIHGCTGTIGCRGLWGLRLGAFVG